MISKKLRKQSELTRIPFGGIRVGQHRNIPVGMIPWEKDAEETWNAWCQRQGVPSGIPPAKGVTLADRMRGWLMQWFPDEDLLVIDGNDVQLKEMAQFLWDSEWEKAGIGDTLKEANAEYSERWGNPPLQPRENNLFILEDEGARIRADRWVSKGQNEGLKMDAWRGPSAGAEQSECGIAPALSGMAFAKCCFCRRSLRSSLLDVLGKVLSTSSYSSTGLVASGWCSGVK